ncbi:MAG: hypothetical protein WC770_08340 [Phycisphaerae bacterium]|jgi:hypothetical protein
MAYFTVNNAKFQSAEKEGLCPICGELMKEVDRMKEGLHFFVWFKCGIKNCDGQWLQKQPVWQTRRIKEPAVNNQQKALTTYLETALR